MYNILSLKVLDFRRDITISFVAKLANSFKPKEKDMKKFYDDLISFILVREIVKEALMEGY